MAAFEVEVCLALPDRAVVMPVTLAPGATVRDAIGQSGLLRQFPGIDWSTHAVGVFGQAVDLESPVRAGDRIEVYRPLSADPREQRRRAAGSRRGTTRPE